MYKIRNIETRVRSVATLYKAILVTGVRQIGKTSLVRHVFPKHRWVSLDRASTLAEAVHQPGLFLQNNPPPCIFDEVQRAPGLFLELKDIIDTQNLSPGSIVLTGSQPLQLMRGVSESLAGRIGIIEMSGMTPSESADIAVSAPTNLLNWITAPPIGSRFPWQMAPAELVFRGGFPAMALSQSSPDEIAVSQRLGDYVQTFLTRDLRDLSQISDLGRFEKFLRFVANTSARLLNVESLSRESGIPQSTVYDWLSVLEAAYVIRKLPGFCGQLPKREAKRSKLLLCDSGLLLHLLGYRSRDLAQQAPVFGSAFETCVGQAIQSLLNREGARVPMYHWRAGERDEVDFVVELTPDMVVPIECKLGAEISSWDLRGLHAFRKLHPSTAPGVIISSGEDCYWIEKDILHIPLSAL
jgi:predicted AAA+ superfamily ATPase